MDLGTAIAIVLSAASLLLWFCTGYWSLRMWAIQFDTNKGLADRIDTSYCRLKEVRNTAHEARQIARQSQERQKGVEHTQDLHVERIAAVEKQVAGMQISREVLTLGKGVTGSLSDPTLSRYGFPEPTFQAAHASCDEPARDAIQLGPGKWDTIAGWIATFSQFDPDNPKADHVPLWVDGIPGVSDRLCRYRANGEFADTPKPCYINGKEAKTYASDYRIIGRHQSRDERPADFDLTAPDADPETAEALAVSYDPEKTDKVDVQAVEEWAEAKRGEVA